MKLQLLELYILHAPDPLLRDVGGTARSKTRHQLDTFMNSKSIKQNDGTEVRLDSWTSDNLARIMVQSGILARFFGFIFTDVRTPLHLQKYY